MGVRRTIISQMVDWLVGLMTPNGLPFIPETDPQAALGERDSDCRSSSICWRCRPGFITQLRGLNGSGITYPAIIKVSQSMFLVVFRDVVLELDLE